MRLLALLGLLLSLVLGGLAVFNTSEAARTRRDAQDHALDGAVSSVVGRVGGATRQMTSVASEMFVDPAVSELLLGGRLTASRRRADTAVATLALGAFERSAIVPVSSACLDDSAAAQVTCGPGAGDTVFPTLLRDAFAAIAAKTFTGLPTPSFSSPVTGRRSGAFVVPLRAGPRLAGLVHFDMGNLAVSSSSLIANDVPGVRVGLAVYSGRRAVSPGEPAAAAPGEARSSVTSSRWWTITAGHRRLVSDLQLHIGDTSRTLAVVATAVAANPTFLNSWGAGMLAVAALAVVMLAGSLVGLVTSGRQVKRELCTDPLTRLSNRRALMEDLPRTCERASEEEPAYLWFFDLNGFKHYNDAFGHLAGDSLLTRLGQRLQDTVSPLGSVYRLGGDEFCALVTAPLTNPLALFEQAREALSERGAAFTITASAGAVEIPREAREATQALRLADQHMYRDKGPGRGATAELVTAVLHAALAQRHPELDEHSSDVACDVELLARAIGLDEESIEMIVRAGDLHDVGKLGIPDSIIAKAGPLSEREWEFMRQHTVMGERIIAAAGPSLERIAPLVRASHERWDGRGYPDGLAGEEIPLGARIITICDSFRAMLSDRPYKEPMSAREAWAELRRCAGSQFDPQLVEVYCAINTADADRERLPGR
jgi:diguanylate cyclase (GGDEF)-like protein